MDLEIKNLFSPDLRNDEAPNDPTDFSVMISASIGETGKFGAEVFYFVAASAIGLQNEVKRNDFKLLRGYILIAEFDWKVIRSAIQNVIDHSRHLENWNEVSEYFRQFAWTDDE